MCNLLLHMVTNTGHLVAASQQSSSGSPVESFECEVVAANSHPAVAE